MFVFDFFVLLTRRFLSVDGIEWSTYDFFVLTVLS